MNSLALHNISRIELSEPYTTDLGRSPDHAEGDVHQVQKVTFYGDGDNVFQVTVFSKFGEGEEITSHLKWRDDK